MNGIAVLGGGAWGTALACVIARRGDTPVLWMRDETAARALNETHRNETYLPDILLPASISATAHLENIHEADVLLMVTPAQTLRSVLGQIKPIAQPGAHLVLCAKGIEKETGKRVSEIACEVMPDNPVSILSGPSFAHDVAKGLPTAVTLASPTETEAMSLSARLSSPTFRLYASSDITGVELGGALKNVIALAIGMVRGRGLGASAEAALTTRGFAELGRIAAHFGARRETLTGLSCLGDLLLTCSSPQSRNFAYGMAIGEGKDLTGMKLAEGVHTTGIAAKLCHDANIDAPIISAINGILCGRCGIEDTMTSLLARPLRAEHEG